MDPRPVSGLGFSILGKTRSAISDQQGSGADG
jgi:hypothetical protein